jgi:glutamine amidotransferase-like uncharacterized protein
LSIRQKDNNKHGLSTQALIKKKGKKMKKIVLTLVALLSLTSVFADEEKTNAVNYVQAYNMNVNMDKLASYLELSMDQAEAVEDVHKTFCADMMNAATASKDERQNMLNKAVVKDLKYMHSILDNDQYRKYLTVLNATLNNRGIQVNAK